METQILRTSKQAVNIGIWLGQDWFWSAHTYKHLHQMYVLSFKNRLDIVDSRCLKPGLVAPGKDAGFTSAQIKSGWQWRGNNVCMCKKTWAGAWHEKKMLYASVALISEVLLITFCVLNERCTCVNSPKRTRLRKISFALVRSYKKQPAIWLRNVIFLFYFGPLVQFSRANPLQGRWGTDAGWFHEGRPAQWLPQQKIDICRLD